MIKQFVFLSIIVFLYSTVGTWANAISKPRLSPVILVPGDGGSQLEARLDKNASIYPFCGKKADWYSLWLNLELLVPLFIYCWIDNVMLYYDEVTRTTHNSNGVEIRVPGWGDPEVVEWIDPTHNKAGAYFKDIAVQLVKLGYERKKSIRGAPYDFRKAPNELKNWFVDLKKLVEDTYELNEESPITFIAHSMGSPLTLVFLQQQSQTWKRKYISKFISLAGAWAGSMKAIKVFAMGDDLDSLLLSGKVLRAEQITNPSTAWLLPSPLFWGPSEVIVETPSREYTMSQMEQFFNDLDYRTGWEMRKDNLKFTLNFSPPDVELHCLYGVGIKTVEKLVYSKDSIAGETPKLLKGDGDGTVNTRSLHACAYWRDTQISNISTVELSGVDHMGILNDKSALDYIMQIMQAQ